MVTKNYLLVYANIRVCRNGSKYPGKMAETMVNNGNILFLLNIIDAPRTDELSDFDMSSDVVNESVGWM